MQGASLQELMELGRWKSYEMALRYAHLPAEHLSNAAARIERRDIGGDNAAISLRCQNKGLTEIGKPLNGLARPEGLIRGLRPLTPYGAAPRGGAVCRPPKPASVGRSLRDLGVAARRRLSAACGGLGSNLRPPGS